MNLAQSLESAFEQIGCSMMSDDFAAKLLAYTLVMGGGNEAVTHHKGLNAGIRIAQQKFNIFGGCSPRKEHADMIRKRVAELEATVDKTEWLNEIFERYDIRLHQS